MDFSGLILLIGLLIIGGALYLASRITGTVARKPDLPRRSDEHLTSGRELHKNSTQDYDKNSARNHIISSDDDCEASEDVFPLIEFPPEPAIEFIPELPASYGENKISLMVRDPKTLYAYWEVTEEKRRELGDKWRQSAPVIRVYDVTGLDFFDGNNANYYQDEMVNDYADSWYISVGEPDRVYCADLGRKFSDGSFLRIARSNYICTPRDSLSGKVDPEWMLVNEDEKKLFARIGRGDGNSSYNLFDWNKK